MCIAKNIGRFLQTYIILNINKFNIQNCVLYFQLSWQLVVQYNNENINLNSCQKFLNISEFLTLL